MSVDLKAKPFLPEQLADPLGTEYSFFHVRG